MKGNVDLIVGMVLLFIFAITLIIGAYVNMKIMEVETLNTTATQSVTNAFGVFNYGTLIILAIGIFGGAIILATQIHTSKIYLPLSLLLMIISVMLASIISNFYADLTTNTELNQVTGDFGLVQQIMFQLPLIFLGGWALLIIATYYKNASGDVTA